MQSADLFPGVWRMTALHSAGPDGRLTPVSYSGQIFFSPDGHMSVQAMDRRPDAPATRYTALGYEATFGQYRLRSNQDVLEFVVTSSLVRSLVGQALLRSFEITTSHLVLSPVGTDERWRVEYARDSR